MADHHTRMLMEQYEETALSMIMDEYAEKEGERLLKEFEEEKQKADLPEIPAALDKTCLELINRQFEKQKRGVRMKRILKTASKAAVIMLVLLGLSTVTVLSVEALRIPALNFLLAPSGEYCTVQTDSDHKSETNTYGNPVADKLSRFIPEGYSEYLAELSFPESGMISYRNAEGAKIILDYAPSKSEILEDSEVIEFTEVEVGKHKGALYKKNGYKLVWLDEENYIVYTLMADGLSIDGFWELVNLII